EPCGSRWGRRRSCVRVGRSRPPKPRDVVKLRSRSAPKLGRMQDPDQLSIELESFPDEVRPMQAVAAEAPFSSPEYLFEVKWDGLRCVLFVGRDREVRVQDRRLNELTPLLPELTASARQVAGGSVLDGELVATDAEGRPDQQ